MEAFKTTLVTSIAAFLIGAGSTAAVSDLVTKPLKAESVFKSSKSRKADVGPFVRAGRTLGGPAPAGYSPLGIAKIDGQRVVIYGFRKGVKLDDATGQGHGSAEVFDNTGHLRRRFIYRENLHSPPQIAEFIYIPER